jgi:regulatory protein
VLRKRRPRAEPGARPAAQAGAEAAAPTDPLAAALGAAAGWLARRDHCSAELAARLEHRGFNATVIEQALGELRERRYLDDERYAREFVRAHAGRGQGPLRIRYELVGLGVPAALAEAALQQQGQEHGGWGVAASRIRRHRFGPALPAERLERARQSRFLQSRGFSTDHIRTALGAGAPDELDAEPTDEA